MKEGLRVGKINLAAEKNIVSIPKDMLPLLERMVHGKNNEENVLISLSISLFLSKTVSLAKTASLAGISLTGAYSNATAL